MRFRRTLLFGLVALSSLAGCRRPPHAERGTAAEVTPTPAIEPPAPVAGERITIENGFVDGSATDTTAHGPVPNLRKAPPPAPTPGLWQIHGVAKNTGAFSLISVASVKGTDRREGKLTAQSDGSALVVTENSGCRRTARLSRG